ncbi:MAG: DUF5055 domain-containing protein [Clostridia bacterium]|nr:DUF5055 domain-containing protein [Clostridia bacterium]
MPKRKNVPADQARKEGKPMAATEKEFSKLTITDTDGTKYTLEFNARVVKNMERRGFKMDTDYPRNMIEDLFVGAFQMHHKGMMPEKIMKIWANQRKKDELLGVLTKLYMKPLEELMAEPDEDENADPTWEVV